MSESLSERAPERTATRAPVGRPVRLQYDDAGKPIEGHCVNVSIGGMFVRVDQPCRPGGLVRFDLEVDAGSSIRGLGESIWQEPPDPNSAAGVGIGIRFRFLEPEDRRKILKLVSHFIKQRLVARHPEFSLEAPSDGEEGEPRARIWSPSRPAEPGDGPAETAGSERLKQSAEGGVGRAETSRPDTPQRVEPAPDPPVAEESFADLAPMHGREERGPDRGRSPWRAAEEGYASRGSAVGPPVVRVSPEPQQASTRPLLPITPAEAPIAKDGGGRVDSDAASEVAASRVDDTDVDTDVMELGSGGHAAVGEDWLRPMGGAPVEEGAPAISRRGPGLPPLVWAGLVLALLLLAWLLWGFGWGGGASAESSTPSSGAPTAAAGSPEEISRRPDPTPPQPAAQDSPLASPRFDKVSRLIWRSGPQGGRLVIRTNGRIPRGSYSHFRLETGQVREVVRLRGVVEPYVGSLPKGGSILQGIRTGQHPNQELHVVLDLLDSRAKILSLEAHETDLIVELGW